jgi:multimeric flavodoxin WrbA
MAMNFLIISGNPKRDGLCQSITDSVEAGARDGGADVKILKTDGIIRCKMCGDGWGICREQHRCAFGGDGFDAAQDEIRNADQLCVITPVYWWDISEGLKGLLDRIRRCEFGGSGALSGKQALLVASPGGTGNGMLEALTQMRYFCSHTGAVIFDFIGVNRWNSDYKRDAAYAAARAMAEGRRAGDTVQN